VGLKLAREETPSLKEELQAEAKRKEKNAGGPGREAGRGGRQGGEGDRNISGERTLCLERGEKYQTLEQRLKQKLG